MFKKISVAVALVALSSPAFADGGPGAEHDDTTYSDLQVEGLTVTGAISGPERDDTSYGEVLTPGKAETDPIVAYTTGPEEEGFDDGGDAR